ncbi:hypothetical protein H0H87_000795 [Tephrocybe sp. NHM501043]|nr:hypothetical protein H0H87_000795 [Tephrocybe sp. NHM501043]
MSPVATIPRIAYETHSQAPYPTRWSAEAPRSELELHYKMQLASKLNTSRLAKLHSGYPFPLYYAQKTHEGTVYHAYQLEEELPIPHFPTGMAYIKFAGHAPNNKNPYLTWVIDLKTSMQSRSSRCKPTTEPPVAKVQVNLAVKRSFYWDALVYDPSTILRALAISLEIEKPISIELYDRSTIVYVTLGRERKNYLVIKESR